MNEKTMNEHMIDIDKQVDQIIANGKLYSVIWNTVDKQARVEEYNDVLEQAGMCDYPTKPGDAHVFGNDIDNIAKKMAVDEMIEKITCIQNATEKVAVLGAQSTIKKINDTVKIPQEQEKKEKIEMTAKQAIREKKNIEKRGNRAEIMYDAETGEIWVDEFVGNNWMEYRDTEGNPRKEIFYIQDICGACGVDLTAENLQKYAEICTRYHYGDADAVKALDPYYAY